MYRRSIVVGDVHGCLQEVDELLKLVSFRQGTDALVFVGDLVDRGPDSAGCVRRARELGAICVLGNHESHHLRYREQLAEAQVRVRMNSNKLHVQATVSDDDWAWIATWPKFHYIDPSLVVVHAGLQRGIAVCDQEERVLTTMRYAKRDTGKMAKTSLRHDELLRPANAAFWVDLWDGKEAVIYGHQIIGRSPVTDVSAGGAICCGIDTGCYTGKALSCAIVVDGDISFASVPARGIYGKQYAEKVVDEE